jgi:hypothetical protein
MGTQILAEQCVKAHILVAFLGYAMWVTLKRLLDRNHFDLSPTRALSLLSTLQSADIVLPTSDGCELRRGLGQRIGDIGNLFYKDVPPASVAALWVHCVDPTLRCGSFDIFQGIEAFRFQD